MTYLLVFAAAFILDIAWGIYVKAIASSEAGTAAAASIVTGGLGLYGVSAVVSDTWLEVPWLIGLASSTYLVVRFHKGDK